jgi:hypothetical protein
MSGNAGWGGPDTPGGYNGPGGPGGAPGAPGGWGPYGGPGGPGGPGRPSPYGGPGGPGWGYVRLAPKPGVIPLQPLGVSEIISGVFGTLKRYFIPIYAPLLAIAGVAAVLMGILAAFAYGPVHTVVTNADNSSDYTPGDGLVVELAVLGGVALLLVMVTGFILYVVVSTVCTSVLRHAVLGRKVTIRQVWAESRPHFWRVAWDSLLLWLGSALSAGLVVGVAAAVGLATHSGGIFALLMLLLLPLGLFLLYLQIRLVLVIPVLVVESERPIAAFRRAWRLNEGAWWRSLGIPLLVSMIGWIASQVILVPVSGIGFGSVFSSIPVDTGDGDPNFPVGSFITLYLLVWLGSALVSALTLPLTPLTNGLLYMDRRIRRESLDVALAAQAAADQGAAPTASPSSPNPAAPAAPSASEPGSDSAQEPGPEAQPPLDLGKDGDGEPSA